MRDAWAIRAALNGLAAAFSRPAQLRMARPQARKRIFSLGHHTDALSGLRFVSHQAKPNF